MPRTYILQAPGGPAFAPRRLPPQRLGGPLSNAQKATLCQLAAKSHDLDGPLSAEEHRHAECVKATGKPGLTACTQDDYKPLLAHFLALTGETGAALNAAIEHGTEPKRIALHKLGEALQKARLPMAYAAAIARRQRGREVADLNVKELWQLIYTINNRGTAKRRARA
jgi:hypothetical protein